MRKFKLVAVIAAVFAFVAAPTAVVPAIADNNPQAEAGEQAQAAGEPGVGIAQLPCKRQSAGNVHVRDIFLSTGSPRTYTGTAWQNVECATTTFRLGFGERALVTADFNAEADCNGSAPTNGQWCLTRALLNGIEGAPMAPEPSSFAFDNVSVGASNWQAHSMNRAWEVRCGVQTGCQYRFAVQTRMHDASVTGMWLDEVAAHLSIVVGNPVPL